MEAVDQVSEGYGLLAEILQQFRKPSQTCPRYRLQVLEVYRPELLKPIDCIACS